MIKNVDRKVSRDGSKKEAVHFKKKRHKISTPFIWPAKEVKIQKGKATWEG